MHDVFGDQIVFAAIASWVIEKLKHSQYFPFIKAETENLNKVFSAVVAALGSAGILFAHTWSPGSHTLTLTLTGLTAANGLNFIWHFVRQYVLMKGVYKYALKPANGNSGQK